MPHSLKFLTQREHRWFWAAALLLSTIGFAWCAGSLLGRLADRPIIVSLAERPEPIWNVPFPAITICPETKAKRDTVRLSEAINAGDSNWDDKTCVRLC